MTNVDSILKSRDITLPTKVSLIKAMVFQVVMYAWELDRKEGWVPKNSCFQTVVLEKTLESPLDSKEIQPVNPIGNQPWIFIQRTDAEAEAPILQPLDVKSWLTGKDPDAGKDWRQKVKRATEDEMVGLHHQLNEHEFEQTLGESEGRGSLACCSYGITKSWTRLSDWTELNWELRSSICPNMELCPRHLRMNFKKPSSREGGLRVPSDAGCPNPSSSTHTQSFIHCVPKGAEASGLFPHIGHC